MGTTRFLGAREVKRILAEYIPARYLSVRTRRSRRRMTRARGQVTFESSESAVISVHPGGTEHAWARRAEIEARGFGLEFYGRAEGGRVVEPTGVRVTTR